MTHDPASGGLAAVDLASGGAGGTFASMLDFRLDPGRRQAITERTLAEHRGGVPRPLIEAIAATLEAGAAILAVLHTGVAATALDEAVARSHGRLIANDPVDARALADAEPAAASRPPAPLVSRLPRVRNRLLGDPGRRRGLGRRRRRVERAALERLAPAREDAVDARGAEDRARRVPRGAPGGG